MLSKFNLIVLLSLVSALLVIAMGLGLGFANEDSGNHGRFSEEMDYVLAYMVEVFTYLCYAMFLAVLVRRTGIAVILLLSIDFFLEPFLGLFLGEPINDYLPMAIIDGLIRFPLLRYINDTTTEGFSTFKLIVALVYGVLAYILSVAIIQKRNL